VSATPAALEVTDPTTPPAQRLTFPEVGGFLPLTSLAKDVVTQRIIKRWDAAIAPDNADSRKQ
jgi:hypothetical protein